MSGLSPAELSGKQRQFLRGLGTGLKPTAYLGKEGISDSLVKSLSEAYANSELVKVRVERSCPLSRKEAAPELARATNSHLIQILGRTVLLYRPDPDEPTIQLPR
jgi:RNA-binding protein